MNYINHLLPYFPEISLNIAEDIIQINDFKRLSECIEIDNNGFRGYQKSIQILYNDNTPYKHLIMKHSMGSGKTRTALGIIINYILINKKNIYIFVVNDSQIINIRKMLLDNLKYLKEYSYDEINKIKNAIIKDVKYNKFSDKKTLINIVKNPPDLIIVDEVHMIHYKHDTDEGFNIYKDIKHNFNALLNKKTKIILMTGTPIINDYKKLLEICDLILPPNLQFYTNNKINNNIVFKKNLELTDKSKLYLKTRFIGITSTVQIKFKNINVIYMGDYLNKLNYTHSKIQNTNTSLIKLYFNKAIDYQDKIISNTKCNEDDYFFVFPKSYNYNLLVNDENKSVYVSWKPLAFLKKNKNLSFIDNLKDINFLHKHSILYYNFIHMIGGLINENNYEAIFYYNEKIIRTGNKFLTLILKVYGMYEIKSRQLNKIFNEVHNNVITNKEEEYKRFVTITSSFGIKSPKDISLIVDIFSHPNNKYGKYLKLIIGSKKMTISYNLINGRQMHYILEYNHSITSQAIARVIRGTSNFTAKESYVKIYAHIILNSKVNSNNLFIKKIKIADKIELKNSKILSIFDQSCIDLYINKNLHSKIEHNNTSIFNYMTYEDNFKYKELNYKIITNPILHDNKILENKINNYIIKNFTTNRVINIYNLQQDLDLTFTEMLFYLYKILSYRNIIFDCNYIPKKLYYMFNILFLADKIIDYTDSLTAITQPITISNKFDQEFIMKNYMMLDFDIIKFINKNNINDYINLKLLIKVSVFEYVILHNINELTNQILNYEYLNYIIFDKNHEIYKKYNIQICHILIPVFLKKKHISNLEINDMFKMRIYSNNEWKNLININNILNIQLLDYIKNKKINKPTINILIPFKYIYIYKNNILKRIESTNLNSKGRNVKTLNVKDKLNHYQEVTDWVKKNKFKTNIKYEDFQNEREEYIYQLQMSILTHLNGSDFIL